MSTNLRSFVPAIYAVGIIMILVALGDLSGTVWPMRPGDVGWRYGAMGISSNYLVTPIFGLLLLSSAAALASHRGFLRFLALLAIVISAAIAAAIALFALDTVQMRQGAEAGAKWVTGVSATIASVKFVCAATVLFILGLGGLRGAKVAVTDRSGRERSGLVVGTS